jgi:hypothetical protein
MYFDKTALNGDAESRAKINIYRTVDAYNSLDAYPSFEKPKRYCISITAPITRNMGATVITVLYPNPNTFVVIVFLLYILFSLTPIPAN